ncbi:MAG: TIGR04551 family protein [Myxococcota bacterium]
MDRWFSRTLVFILLAAASPVRAQSSGTSSAAIDLEALRRELREQIKRELKDELKEELKEELSEESADTLGPVQTDSWAEQDWSWEEPTEPELNFLEFDGYFRFRWGFFENLDLGTTFVNNEDGVPDAVDIFGPFAEPVVFATEGDVLGPGTVAAPSTICVTDFGGDGTEGCADVLGENAPAFQSAANMRLRLEPTLNVYEDIKIKSQIDVFDNLILGSTSESLPFNPISPLSVLGTNQVPPVAGINTAVSDAIRVKRLWGEVTTPLGQIRFGRQPDHFGLGIMANDGNDVDNDFGDNVDRIMFATRFGDIHIMPAYDWLATGPISRTIYEPFGQPFDRSNRDDVERWNLRIIKQESDEVIDQKLASDKVVWNLGGYGTFRRQQYDVPDFFRSVDGVANQAATNAVIQRNAQIGTGSFWARIMWRKLLVEAEYGFIIGNITNPIETRLDASGEDQGFDAGSDLEDVSIDQHGGALKAQYKFLKDRLSLEFLFLFATGDGSAGWGVRPFLGANTRQVGGIWDGDQSADGSVTNFRFNPAYNFDRILWRQLVGTFTDGLVFRPSVQYNITEELGARLDIIYSRALFAASTPSGSLINGDDVLNADSVSAPLGGPDANLGVELDFKLFFVSDNGFNTWLQYASFIAMDGLDRLVPDESATDTLNGQGVRRLDAGVAHNLQLFLGITF